MALPDSAIQGVHAIELTLEHAPLLQRFFEANPAYFLATSGEPAGLREGLETITGEVPAEMSCTSKRIFGYVGPEGSLVAMAHVVTDLLASSIHHIGLFIVATDLHGSGQAQRLYQALERWAIAERAAWLRLSVVAGNTRAERFWAAQGYRPVRERPGVRMGPRVVTLRTLVKPLAAGSLEPYFSLAPRDRPEPEGLC
jgi:GNAT superfamily N-acetyltransferase